MCVYGLGTAVDVVLSHVEHRFCIRHLHANCKARGYTGKAFKDEIWGLHGQPTSMHSTTTCIIFMKLANVHTLILVVWPSNHGLGMHSTAKQNATCY